MTLWGAAAVILMFPFTLVFWQHLPKLRFVQLPWRWLLAANVSLAFLLSAGTRKWFNRLALSAALLLVLIGVARRTQLPWWDTAADIDEMKEAISSGQGYEGTDEYVPAGADPYELKQDAKQAAVKDDTAAQVFVRTWTPQLRRAEVDGRAAGSLVLRLFNYPAWQVRVNGHLVQAQSADVTGEIVVPLAAGRNDVEVRFTRTWDRTLGGWISVLTALIMALWQWRGAVLSRQRKGRL
jgi:hypothetical protein